MRWKGKTVLVTGGTGFIGSFVVEHLLDAGAKVRVPLRSENYRSLSSRRSEVEWMEGDLRDTAYCQELVRGVDFVFHMASCRRTPKAHRQKCGDIAQENVRMTLALLEALREEEMSVPVVFFSTANVPPDLDVIALAQHETVDGYVLGKALSETLWFTAAKQRGFPLLILRPVGVYGPRDTFADDANIIPAFFVKARDGKKELRVWGTGEEERAFLYVEDLVDALFQLLQEDVRGIQYITSGEVVSIDTLVTAIRDLVRPGFPIIYDAEKALSPRAIPQLPLHEALTSFRWTPLKEGLRKTYESWK